MQRLSHTHIYIHTLEIASCYCHQHLWLWLLILSSILLNLFLIIILPGNQAAACIRLLSRTWTRVLHREIEPVIETVLSKALSLQTVYHYHWMTSVPQHMTLAASKNFTMFSFCAHTLIRSCHTHQNSKKFWSCLEECLASEQVKSLMLLCLFLLIVYVEYHAWHDISYNLQLYINYTYAHLILWFCVS